MQVTTQSPKLEKLRRGVMELYISDHPLDCLTCAANGDCELQDMAGEVGLREVRYGYDGANHLGLEKDTSNPYFTFDTSKCIVCSRCVRACEEIQGTFALTIAGRGFGSRVAAGFKGSFFESDCVSCGACVQACPTATLTENSVIEHGQPRREVITTCAYCGVGCSFKAGTDDLRESPYVELIERLIGKGFNVKIYDPNVRLSALIGANREFLMRKLPHISSILVETADEAMADANVVLLTTLAPEYVSALPRLREDQRLLDFAGLNDRQGLSARYDGVNW